MKKTQLILIGFVLAMLFAVTNSAYRATLILDVKADAGAFNAAFGDIDTGGHAFYIPGDIFEAGTTNSIGTFPCRPLVFTGIITTTATRMMRG